MQYMHDMMTHITETGAGKWSRFMAPVSETLLLLLLVLKSYTRYTHTQKKEKKKLEKSEIKTIQSTKIHVNNWLIHQIQSSVVSCIPGIDKIFSRIIINSNAQRTLCTNSVPRPV